MSAPACGQEERLAEQLLSLRLICRLWWASRCTRAGHVQGQVAAHTHFLGPSNGAIQGDALLRANDFNHSEARGRNCLRLLHKYAVSSVK